MKIFTIFLTIIFFSCFNSPILSAQTKAYFVRFKDKIGTPFTIDKPAMFLSSRSIQRRIKQNIAIKEDDLPVNPNYIAQLEAAIGVKTRYQSRWFNSVLVFCTAAQHELILKLPFVASGKMLNERNGGKKTEDTQEKNGFEEIENFNLLRNHFTIPYAHFLAEFEPQEENYGASLTQNKMLGIDEMHKDGFHGEGMLIAVLDGGFPSVNKLSAFKDLDIADTYNFISARADVFTAASHGTKVLSTIAAYKPGTLVSGAYKSRYALFITEDGASEMPVEEAYWVFGAERADSLGVDVMNTSLGYYDFDNATYNYTQSQLDGKTALISQASEKAFEKGIFVITSAGNEGSKPWAKITFPGDAPNTLTVGSVDASQNYSSFSSIGLTADGRIKPDVMAMGSSTVLWNTTDGVETASGTSFASPLVCGLVAGFWQANPNMTAAEVLSVMRRSGTRINNPNEQFGYGIPHYGRAQALKNITGITNEQLKDIRLLTNPIKDGLIRLVTPSDYVGKKMAFQIITPLGQVVKNGEVSIADIDTHFFVNDVPAGFMFLQIKVADQTKVIRLVME
jgi:hypothetical protein